MKTAAIFTAAFVRNTAAPQRSTGTYGKKSIKQKVTVEKPALNKQTLTLTAAGSQKLYADNNTVQGFFPRRFAIRFPETITIRT